MYSLRRLSQGASELNNALHNVESMLFWTMAMGTPGEGMMHYSKVMGMKAKMCTKRQHLKPFSMESGHPGEKTKVIDIWGSLNKMSLSTPDNK